jgi:hypothetical protein
MIINDINYMEAVSEANEVQGGALVLPSFNSVATVGGSADAFGLSLSTTDVQGATQSISLPNSKTSKSLLTVSAGSAV